MALPVYLKLPVQFIVLISKYSRVMMNQILLAHTRPCHIVTVYHDAKAT